MLYLNLIDIYIYLFFLNVTLFSLSTGVNWTAGDWGSCSALCG